MAKDLGLLKREVLQDLAAIFPQLPECLLREVMDESLGEKDGNRHKHLMVQSCIDQLLDTCALVSFSGNDSPVISVKNPCITKSVNTSLEDRRTFPSVSPKLEFPSNCEDEASIAPKDIVSEPPDTHSHMAPPQVSCSQKAVTENAKKFMEKVKSSDSAERVRSLFPGVALKKSQSADNDFSANSSNKADFAINLSTVPFDDQSSSTLNIETADNVICDTDNMFAITCSSSVTKEKGSSKTSSELGKQNTMKFRSTEKYTNEFSDHAKMLASENSKSSFSSVVSNRNGSLTKIDADPTKETLEFGSQEFVPCDSAFTENSFLPSSPETGFSPVISNVYTKNQSQIVSESVDTKNPKDKHVNLEDFHEAVCYSESENCNGSIKTTIDNRVHRKSVSDESNFSNLVRQNSSEDCNSMEPLSKEKATSVLLQDESECPSLDMVVNTSQTATTEHNQVSLKSVDLPVKLQDSGDVKTNHLPKSCNSSVMMPVPSACDTSTNLKTNASKTLSSVALPHNSEMEKISDVKATTITDKNSDKHKVMDNIKVPDSVVKCDSMNSTESSHSVRTTKPATSKAMKPTDHTETFTPVEKIFSANFETCNSKSVENTSPGIDCTTKKNVETFVTSVSKSVEDESMRNLNCTDSEHLSSAEAQSCVTTPMRDRGDHKDLVKYLLQTPKRSNSSGTEQIIPRSSSTFVPSASCTNLPSTSAAMQFDLSYSNKIPVRASTSTEKSKQKLVSQILCGSGNDVGALNNFEVVDIGDKVVHFTDIVRNSQKPSDVTGNMSDSEEELNSSLQKVLDIFPEADNDWVENQLKAMRTTNPTNYTEVVCNIMFESPYKHRPAEGEDTPPPLLSKSGKCRCNLDFQAFSNSPLESSRQTLNCMLNPPLTEEVSRKRKADTECLEEFNQAVSIKQTMQDGLKKEVAEAKDVPVSVHVLDEYVTQISTKDDGCLVCEGCSKSTDVSDLGQCCDGHLLCCQCIEDEVKIFLGKDSKKSQVDCRVEGCTSFLTLGEVKRKMPLIIGDLIYERLDKQNIAAINSMENIVRCPNCGFAAELLYSTKEFSCGNTNCKLTICRYCKRPWKNNSHSQCTPLLSLVERKNEDGVVTLSPRYWKDIPDILNKDFFVVPVEMESIEFQSVQDLMKVSMPHVHIKNIYRIQNNKLWEKYYLTRKHLCDDLGNLQLNEKHLFHGTPSKCIEQICQQGFDWRLSGKQVGAAIGEGTYFAVSALYSDGLTASINEDHNVMKSFTVGEFVPMSENAQTTYSQSSSMEGTPGTFNPPTPLSTFISAVPNFVHGFTSKKRGKSRFQNYSCQPGSVKLMFMARVLCGRSFQGSQGVRRPPEDRQDPKHRLFNSAVDNLQRPSMYVVFDSSQCYPEYVLEYYCS